MNYLQYGDTIMYPMLKPDGRVSFPGMSIHLVSSSGKTNLVQCSIDIDHVFPNDATELRFGLSERTHKVTITPVSEEDQFIYGRERTYFSDIKSSILEHNPQFQIQPYPKELLEN